MGSKRSGGNVGNRNPFSRGRDQRTKSQRDTGLTRADVVPFNAKAKKISFAKLAISGPASAEEWLAHHPEFKPERPQPATRILTYGRTIDQDSSMDNFGDVFSWV